MASRRQGGRQQETCYSSYSGVENGRPTLPPLFSSSLLSPTVYSMTESKGWSSGVLVGRGLIEFQAGLFLSGLGISSTWHSSILHTSHSFAMATKGKSTQARFLSTFTSPPPSYSLHPSQAERKAGSRECRRSTWHGCRERGAATTWQGTPK